MDLSLLLFFFFPEISSTKNNDHYNLSIYLHVSIFKNQITTQSFFIRWFFQGYSLHLALLATRSLELVLDSGTSKKCLHLQLNRIAQAILLFSLFHPWEDLTIPMLKINFSIKTCSSLGVHLDLTTSFLIKC